MYSDIYQTHSVMLAYGKVSRVGLCVFYLTGYILESINQRTDDFLFNLNDSFLGVQARSLLTCKVYFYLHVTFTGGLWK